MPHYRTLASSGGAKRYVTHGLKRRGAPPTGAVVTIRMKASWRSCFDGVRGELFGDRPRNNDDTLRVAHDNVALYDSHSTARDGHIDLRWVVDDA